MGPQDCFAIGDIHGCAVELKILLNKLPLTKESTVVFLGDYIDRGPESKEVINTILDLKKKMKVICLMGNHERMFLDFLAQQDSPEAHSFIFNGGGATLASYSSGPEEFHIDEEHMNFFSELLPFYEWGDYFFVHAGVPAIRLNKIHPLEHEHCLLWSRDEFLSLKDYQWEKIIVHGHTPVEDVQILKNRINLDTGCVYDGMLSAINLTTKQLYSVQKRDSYVHVTLKSEFPIRRGARYTFTTMPLYIEIDDHLHQFEVLNFSEFGMLILEVSDDAPLQLSKGDKIQGHLGQERAYLTPLEATVVWVDQFTKGKYGIEFLTPFPPKEDFKKSRSK